MVRGYHTNLAYCVVVAVGEGAIVNSEDPVAVAVTKASAKTCNDVRKVQKLPQKEKYEKLRPVLFRKEQPLGHHLMGISRHS